MAQITAAGSKLYLSDGATTASDSTTFAALTWLEVGEITNLGEFGKVYQDIATNTINQRQTKHAKGAFDEGVLNLTVYADPSDAGQAEALVALEDDAEWGIKITLNDGTTTPTTIYYRGLVSSFRRTISDVNSMVTASIQIMLNTEAVEVAAT